VSSIDILPTILDAANVTPPPKLPGLSLRPLMEGNNKEWRSHLFCEWNSSHPHPPPCLLYPQRSIRDNRYKLIVTLLDNIDNPVEEYYTKHTSIDTGTTQWELDHCTDEQVRKVYSAWRRPQPIELYDLQNDPWEFNNLIDNPELADVRDSLLQSLTSWQKETHDTIAEPARLSMLVEEHEKVKSKPGSHKKPDFHYRYLEYLYDKK